MWSVKSVSPNPYFVENKPSCKYNLIRKLLLL